MHTRNESFNEVVEMSGSGTVIVKFPSNGEWVFNRLDGSATSGKISMIVDRNSNRLLFNYDAQGRLTQVIDTLGRTNQVDYNAQGFIQSVTDFAGRALTYRYHDLGSAGGNKPIGCLPLGVEIELPGGRLYSVTGHPTPVIRAHGTGGSYKLFIVTGQPTPVGRSTITGIEIPQIARPRGSRGRFRQHVPALSIIR